MQSIINSFATPDNHEPNFKKEVDRLIIIGVLKKINNSKWPYPIFITSNINGAVRIISDFRLLNKTIKKETFSNP